MRPLFWDYESGTWIEWLNPQDSSDVKWNYRVRIKKWTGLTCVLAIVKPTNDGRFTWIRKRIKDFDTHVKRTEPMQGVCRTLGEAQEKAIEDIKQWYAQYRMEYALYEMQQKEKSDEVSSSVQ